MTTAEAVKEPGSATTSVNGRERRPHRSETEFLQAETQAARQAIADTLVDLKADVLAAADLPAWAKIHPWATAGAAAAAGWVIASLIVPRPAERAMPLSSATPQPATSAAAQPAGPSWKRTLLTMLFDLAATGVQQWFQSITAAAKGAAPVDPVSMPPANDEHAQVEA